MELGPQQKQWVADLRQYPERQYKNFLGYKNHHGELKLCCLGQLIISSCYMTGEDAPWNGNELKSTLDNNLLCDDEDLGNVWGDYKLHSEGGLLVGETLIHEDEHYNTLVEANDGGVPWGVIADFIEQYPKAVFTESK